MVDGSASIAGVTIWILAIDRSEDATGMRVAVRTTVTDHGGSAVMTEPHLRYYPGHDLTVSVPGIRAGLTRDVYTTVLAVAEDGTSATVRLAVNPLVGLVWIGGFLVALGERCRCIAGAGRLCPRPNRPWWAPREGGPPPGRCRHRRIGPGAARCRPRRRPAQRVAGARPRHIGAGSAAADLVGSALDGSHFDLTSYHGSIVVINVWASWCSPCRAELPLLAGAERTWSADGVVVVGLNLRDSAEAAQALLNEAEATNLITVADPTGEMAVS